MSVHFGQILFIVTVLPLSVASVMGGEVRAEEGLCERTFLASEKSFNGLTVISPSRDLAPRKEILTHAKTIRNLLQSSFIRVLNAAETSDSLNKLEDGIYVYLIDSGGNVAFMNRVAADQNGEHFYPGQFVGGHNTLHKILPQKEVISAGEFTIRSGLVRMINNKSGSFPGDALNLQVAVDILPRVGLPLTYSTTVVDVSKGDGPREHGTAIEQISDFIQIRKDNELKSIYEDAQVSMRLATLAGEELKQLLREQITGRGEFKSYDANTAAIALQFLSAWQHPVDEPSHVVKRFNEVLGEREFRKVLRIIREESETVFDIFLKYPELEQVTPLLRRKINTPSELRETYQKVTGIIDQFLTGLSDSELQVVVQMTMDKLNRRQGYLPGLSPANNVTQVDQLTVGGLLNIHNNLVFSDHLIKNGIADGHEQKVIRYYKHLKISLWDSSVFGEFLERLKRRQSSEAQNDHAR